MAQVTIERVHKRYGDVVAVDDVSLVVADGEFLVLLGPSGCGKTTTLRMVAGLEEISAGRILLDDAVINGVHPRDRDVAMVFQSYALYPHMTVAQNLSYGLKMRRMPAAEIQSRVAQACAMLQIDELMARKPAELSGGQRQRVALGRAIVRRPAVFLMDEPLSNLDAKLRVQMREELIRLHHRLGVTTLYVTHDQVEAMTMGSRIAVMHQGQVQQIGPPLELYRRPANLFVAAFLGSPQINLLEGRVVGGEEQATFHGAGVRLLLPAALAGRLATALPQAVEPQIVLGMRPEQLRVAASEAAQPMLSLGSFTVEYIEHLGRESFAGVARGETRLIVEIDPDGPWQDGAQVSVAVNPEAMLIFDANSGRRVQQSGELA